MHPSIAYNNLNCRFNEYIYMYDQVEDVIEVPLGMPPPNKQHANNLKNMEVHTKKNFIPSSELLLDNWRSVYLTLLF